MIEIIGKIDLVRRFGIFEMILNSVRCKRFRSVGFNFRSDGERIGTQIIESVERDGKLG